MQLKLLKDADVAGKRIVLRVDFNIPEQEGSGERDLRIKAAVPTIEFLKQHGAAKITLLTHWGRPQGSVVEALRTAPLFAMLSKLTDTANVEMLENLRFDPREEANDDTFAQELAAHGDIFVNDAFAVCHRAAASTVGITKFLPSYAGLLVEKEIAGLSKAFTPAKPSLAIVGGAKLETKLPLIHKLSPVYDKVLVGGALANEYKESVPNVLLPEDGIPQKEGMLDIGPRAREAWVQEVKQAAFVLWNGPVGWYEKGYSEGTYALAEALVEAGIPAVIGGGDTASALAKYPLDPEKVFISTGGGAALEFLTSGTLVALECLRVS
jgi:phosphoglycerate kinase